VSDVPPRVSRYGDAALLVEYGSAIDARVNARVLAAADALRRRRVPGMRDIVPAFASLAVHFDPLSAAVDDVEAAVTDVLASEPGSVVEAVTRPPLEIPVCYGGAFGPDLDAVAAWSGCSADEVVAIHSEPTYRVFMLGFLPGFAYLGTVDGRIAMPRHPAPRTQVAAGSVGIAGQQTGVYPLDSPGGWQIIGRTPLNLFDARRTPPARIRPGGFVRFVPISPADLERVERTPLPWP
jgi:inhibitor of KinA